MINRILSLPLSGTNSIFLFGPRGTGKTSYIKAYLPDALYIDLLDYAFYAPLAANPSKLEQLIPPSYDGWIVLDEVQRIPELLNEVHRLIEHKKYKFILTGSSARTLKRSGVNLLAGRALRYTMHPLIYQELGAAFNFDHALLYGLLPAVITHEDPKKYLESYIHTYIKEEVLQEGLIRNVGAFTRFLEVASFSQGNVLNMTEISRELSLNRLTVANYFDILDDLLLAVRIPVFAKRAQRKVIAHQKFYFFDCGVYNHVRPRGLLDSLQEIEGAALETLFLQSLRAVNDYYELGYSIHFWRTLTGDEVDFVLYGPKGFHAFEIKRSSYISPKALKGLQTFSKEYPESTCTLLYGGKMTEYHDKIKVMPFMDALKDLPAILA
jgi:uncharacterized protein